MLKVEEIKIAAIMKELYMERKTIRECAAVVGVSYGVAHRILHENTDVVRSWEKGKTRDHAGKFDGYLRAIRYRRRFKKVVKQALRLIKYSDIAKDNNCDLTTVNNIIDKAGIRPIIKQRKEAIVQERNTKIREMYQAGYIQRDIAKTLNIGIGSVSRILNS